MSDIVERVRSAVNAIQANEETLEAWAYLDPERALDNACLVQGMISQGLRLSIGGMTLGIKDIIDVAGMPTVAGFRPRQGSMASSDSTLVARLRAAGGIIIGKTATTQFAASDPAPTCNPWNLERSPGGSSAGSAVAVAARQVEVAIGTQTAGSVLRPASYCGVLGFKPTFGSIPTDGMIAYSPSLDTIGFMARRVDDIVRAFAAATNRPVEQSDPPAVPAPRIGIWADALAHASEQMRDAVIDAIEQLARSGAQVFDATCPLSFDNVLAIHRTIVRCEAAAVHARMFSTYPDDYGPKLRATLEVGSVIPVEHLARAFLLRREFRERIEREWSLFDLIAMPTSSTAAPSPETTGDHGLQTFASLFGFPALTIPIGFDRDHLPIGIQIVAPRRGMDDALLGFARWIEKFMPEMPTPPYAAH